MSGDLWLSRVSIVCSTKLVKVGQAGQKPKHNLSPNTICTSATYTTCTWSVHICICMYVAIYNQSNNTQAWSGYTRHDWFNILYVAMSWEFEEIQRLTMQQIKIIDNHLEGQQENNQLTRRFPSPTDTEPMSDLENKYDNMYVDESQWA